MKKLSTIKYLQWARKTYDDDAFSRVVKSILEGAHWLCNCEGLTALKMKQLGYAVTEDWLM